MIIKKQIKDQALHFAWSALAISPIIIIGPSVASGALAGLLIGLPRELVDQWPIGHWKDTILDLAFFTAGGAAVVAMLS